MTGTTLTHYRITAKLGQGGMGAVYRATDTKLDREVAIQVLLESFAQDRERLGLHPHETGARVEDALRMSLEARLLEYQRALSQILGLLQARPSP